MGYIGKYKPFLIFLVKFFATYAILGALYSFWLSRYEGPEASIDPATKMVARQSVWLIKLAGANAEAVPHESRSYLKLFFEGDYTARIIEGCNAISVMILFVSFLVAFSGTLKNTVLFAFSGCIIIHILNISRIALLSAAIYHFPEQEHFLHGVVFPLFIYGVVFILWVIWVNRFSYYANVKK